MEDKEFSKVVEAGEDREERIKELVSKMSLEEKVQQMSGSHGLKDLPLMAVRYNLRPYNSGENRRLGIPPVSFTDGPHGIVVGRGTCFPVSMARGATWDAELEERVGYAMGVEARAKGANFFGGVCINLPRHPGWGRAQETFGEDPFLLGVMGVALISGVQRHVMACAKHYACNSIEEARFTVDVQADERTLREVYLPHFKMCAEAGVAAFMSAYNRVNGHFCGHSRVLLTDILKGDWKFDGFVISDFLLGIRSAKLAANAGLDIEMPITWRYGKNLKKAVLKGEVSENTLDQAVTRIIRQKARFAKVGKPGGYKKSRVLCKEHTDLALEVARKSIVLLKNEGPSLPLERDRLKKIAVIGELADRANLGDRGSSRVYPPYGISPLEGIRERAGDSVEIVYEKGDDLYNARRIARESDAAVVVVGLTWRDEGEFIPVVALGGDRENLDLSEAHETLIRAVSEESGRCIVVVEGGSAITMERWKDKVEAILMAWYPGMEGGYAIADILFGDVNPSGKLPITFPRSTEQLPHFEKKARKIEYGYYHGYRLFDKKDMEPAFHFGFGLSYTEYRYSNLRLSHRTIGRSGSIRIEVDVTNAGGMAGEETVQIYVGCPGLKADRPLKELKGFGRLKLEPGETKTMSFEINAPDLTYFDADKKEWAVEEGGYTIYAGPSSRWKDLLRATFEIWGP